MLEYQKTAKTYNILDKSYFLLYYKLTMRPLATFDIDGTMLPDMSFLPMVETQATEGLLEPSIWNRAQELETEFHSGSLTFETYVKELLGTYAGGLLGRPIDEIAESTQQFFDNTEFFGFIGPTIEKLSPTHDLLLVTSNTQFAAAAVAKIFGTKDFCSTMLEVSDGRLTGKISSMLSSRHAKRAAIEPYVATHQRKGSFAFGDSVGDSEVLRAADYPICIKPTDGLRAIGEELGWHIVDEPGELNAKQYLTVVRNALRDSRLRSTTTKIDDKLKREYANSDGVQARMRTEELAGVDMQSRVIDALQLTGNEVIVEPGAGDAGFLQRIGRSAGSGVRSFAVDPYIEQYLRAPAQQPINPDLAYSSSRRFLEGKGVELSEDVLRGVTQTIGSTVLKYNIYPIRAIAEDLPFPDRSADRMTHRNYLYHLGLKSDQYARFDKGIWYPAPKDHPDSISERQRSALEESSRVLKSGGLEVHETSGPYHKIFQHVDLSKAIAKYCFDKTGIYTEVPELMNQSFDTEKAKIILPLFHDFVYVLELNRDMIVGKDDNYGRTIYLQSVYSTRIHFDPIPGIELFIEAVDKVAVPMLDERILDSPKAPPSPDQLISADSGLSSLDVAKAPFSLVKPLSTRADLPWERAILGKSSIDKNEGKFDRFSRSIFVCTDHEHDPGPGYERIYRQDQSL